MPLIIASKSLLNSTTRIYRKKKRRDGRQAPRTAKKINDRYSLHYYAECRTLRLARSRDSSASRPSFLFTSQTAAHRIRSHAKENLSLGYPVDRPLRMHFVRSSGPVRKGAYGYSRTQVRTRSRRSRMALWP